jgi:hypothetical protein
MIAPRNPEISTHPCCFQQVCSAMPVIASCTGQACRCPRVRQGDALQKERSGIFHTRQQFTSGAKELSSHSPWRIGEWQEEDDWRFLISVPSSTFGPPGCPTFPVNSGGQGSPCCCRRTPRAAPLPRAKKAPLSSCSPTKTTTQLPKDAERAWIDRDPAASSPPRSSSD